MPTTSRDQASNQEGRLILAINAYETKQISSIRAAAKAYDVSPSSLAHRIRGRTTRENSQLNN
jgi:predicted HTH domain antitoxin